MVSYRGMCNVSTQGGGEKAGKFFQRKIFGFLKYFISTPNFETRLLNSSATRQAGKLLHLLKLSRRARATSKQKPAGEPISLISARPNQAGPGNVAIRTTSYANFSEELKSHFPFYRIRKFAQNVLCPLRRTFSLSCQGRFRFKKSHTARENCHLPLMVSSRKPPLARRRRCSPAGWLTLFSQPAKKKSFLVITILLNNRI